MFKNDSLNCAYILRILACILVLSLCIFPASAIIVDVAPTNAPHGAVILIMDGVSSCYIYPEFTPYAIDGSLIEKADNDNMSFIFDQSCRVLDVVAPQTYTEAGHSVLVTGYSRADGDIVGGYDTTIYDVAHDYDYLTFAIMEKGDFSSMCEEQNVVVHDATNSINNPEMLVKTNIHSIDNKKISMDVAKFFQDQASIIPFQLQNYPEGSIERYNAYNKWAIETAINNIEFMARTYPEEHYILTINVGATDSAGHYKKDSGYIATIEGIDSVCKTLYDTCNENNIAFVMTADHGMAFSTEDSRGGHQSKKYSVTTEAQKVPFVISSPNVKSGLVQGEFGQEDIPPTILSVLELPDKLRLADGSTIPVTKHITLNIKTFETGNIILLNNGMILAEASSTSNCLFRGIEPGPNYTIRFLPDADENNVLEQKIDLQKSETIVFSSSSHKSLENNELLNSRHIIGGSLIALINVTGLIMIRRILKSG